MEKLNGVNKFGENRSSYMRARKLVINKLSANNYFIRYFIYYYFTYKIFWLSVKI